MINDKGQMFIEDNDIIELMLSNRKVKILPRNVESYQNFEKECKSYGISNPFEILKDSDSINWHMPNEFKNIDIKDFIFNKHTNLNHSQKARIESELKEFEKRNLVELLRFLVYFVIILKSNNIIYGVGRGSSIASYVLFLIGVHRIDSHKYNLDIKEFLK